MAKHGFDAFIGNPPWVLYAGKGKQPIDQSEEELLKELFDRAARTLSSHGIFATQAGRLCRPGGRVGLVMPTSMVDASRYQDARAAHEAWCIPEPELPDFGQNAFVGVFQPCMGLISERRAAPIDEEDTVGAPWALAQTGVDVRVRRLLEKLDALPRVPAELFGERGYRSSKADEGKFVKADGRHDCYQTPLYEGTSVREFQLLGPTAFADATRLPEVVRRDKWESVAVFIRQTARYPIAARSARAAFRNSILAGFEHGLWNADALLGYLNSTPVRWYHFHKQRDAQQGMPQVKIAHLRALPALDAHALAAIGALARRLVGANRGIEEREREELDVLVGSALALDAEELSYVREWGTANPPPVGREIASGTGDADRRLGPGVRSTVPADTEAESKRTAKAGS